MSNKQTFGTMAADLRKSKAYRRLEILLLTTLLPTLLAACSTQKPYELELMPAPDVYSELKVNPFSGIDFNHAVPYGGMLYATDRKPATGNKAEGEFYENHRGHLLRLGVGTIQFAEGQFTWEELKKISIKKTRGKNYPLHVSSVNEFGVLDDSRSRLIKSRSAKVPVSGNRAFAAAINKKLALSKHKDIYIYVHGYKIVFTNPLLVATEFWHYLGYRGVFIAYSWPATPNRLAYARDLETAAYSSRNLRLLLTYLARSTNARRIHIIAHSAGTRVAIDALAQLALMNPDRSPKSAVEKYRVGKVILIGSDMDRDIFAGYLEDGLLDIPESLTLYMSGTDKALRLSNFLFTRQRVGQAINVNELPPESVDFLRHATRLNIIDATAAENAGAVKGHDYFRRSPWVSSDVLVSLKYGFSPQARGLVRDDKLPVWRFPKDYITRVGRKLGKIVDDNN